MNHDEIDDFIKMDKEKMNADANCKKLCDEIKVDLKNVMLKCYGHIKITDIDQDELADVVATVTKYHFYKDGLIP